MAFLGSAAVGTAGALGRPGGHVPGKEKRRASSARRARSKPKEASERSRSPTDEQPDIQIDVAARAILAPLYVEPGSAGDELGIEGRHRSNMGKLFDYLAHVERVTNENADLLDGLSYESRVLKRADRNHALETQSIKIAMVDAGEELKQVAGIVEANDAKLKEDMASSVRGLWEFLEANNGGIMNMFQVADASVKLLEEHINEAAKHIQQLKADEGTKPSQVASGPKGLAFVSLRADMLKLGR